MKNIYYISNPLANPICRDAGKKFLNSLDFKDANFNDLETLLLNENNLVFIELGWYDEIYFKNIYRAIIEYGRCPNLLYRIVDDNPTSYGKIHKEIKDIFCNQFPELGTRLIAPYDRPYFGKYIAKVIPYHYEDNDSIHLETEHRLDKAILTGFNLELYPLRFALYKEDNDAIVKFTHPGYSGRCWNSNNIGDGYVKELSKYKLMLVTTGEEDELLKYVECAQAGCAPLGDFPRSLLTIMPTSLKYLHCSSVSDLISKLPNVLSNWEYYSTKYREFMKRERSLEKIKELYETL